MKMALRVYNSTEPKGPNPKTIIFSDQVEPKNPIVEFLP